MKKVLCLLLVFLMFYAYGANAKSIVLNQIPNQLELIVKAQKRIVYITPYGKKYHTKDCTHTKATNPLTAEKARAEGYTPCAHCIPQHLRGDL